MSLYIKIELFSRYPRLVLSSPSLPIALVNAKYKFCWKSFQTKRFYLDSALSIFSDVELVSD